MIKNIIFDLDQTLVQSFKATDKLFDYIVMNNEIDASGVEFRKYFRKNLVDFMNENASNVVDYGVGTYDFFQNPNIYSYIPKKYHDFKNMILEKTFNDLKIKYPVTNYNKIIDDFINEWLGFYELFNDAVILESLFNNYRLFVFTNGFENIQKAKAIHTGIDKYFEDIITSEGLGTAKPDTNAFNKLMESNNLIPDETIMIGDSYETDIVGAQKAGMHSVLILRNNEPIDDQFDSIRTLYDLEIK